MPGQPNTFYFGSVGGGVWKTTNAGRTWTPIFDVAAASPRSARSPSRRRTRTSSTSAPARPTCAIADLRSATACTSPTDAGQDLDAHRPRRHAADRPGHRRSARIPTSCSSPRSATSTAPHPDRGVYRSRDGGATWQKVLFKGDDVGAIDLAFDPSNSQTIYASLWNTRRPPWCIYPPSNGPGSGLYKSTDGGDNWQPADAAACRPKALGRIGIAVAPANPQPRLRDRRREGRRAVPLGRRRRDVRRRRRATRASGDAAGTSARSPSIRRTPTSSTCSNTGVYRSRDGGRTFGEPFKGSPGGDDYHQLWIAPDDSQPHDPRRRPGRGRSASTA